MNFGFWDIITILGALAFFVYGMKMMSDGIQRAAGSQLRNILRTMTKNRFLGVFTGFLITALVQSSSATTVMTVSFVNAGLLSLVESAGVMMGANIGTTITGWIISILGFKVKLSAYSIPLFAIGVPLMFSRRGKLRYWGEFLIGFAILFLGLSYLKNAVPDIGENAAILEWVNGFTGGGIASRFFFVLVGALVTVIVQSSSAAMAITLTLVFAGWLPLDIACAMVLGENIGTTITAEIASLVGNVHAKRSARIHSMFNIIGVAWMLILLPYILPFLETFVESFTHIFEGNVKGGDKGLTASQAMNTYKLAAFHTAFNLMNVLLMLAFVPWLVKTAIATVPNKEEEEEFPKLRFISGLNRTPELATVELQKETAHFGEIVSRMSSFANQLMNTTESKEQQTMFKKLEKYESITDDMEIEITEYISNLASEKITPKTSLRLRSILNICNDLERIGDLFYQVSKTLERKLESNIYFTPEQRNNLNEMFTLIDEAFQIMVGNLSTPSYDDVDKANAVDIESKINAYRNKLRAENVKMLGTKEYNVQSAMFYNNVFSNLERIGDHIINVSEAVVGEI